MSERDPHNTIREALERERTRLLRGGYGQRRITDAITAFGEVEAERDKLKQAFATEVRVCSARTTMLDEAKRTVARQGEALRTIREWVEKDLPAALDDDPSGFIAGIQSVSVLELIDAALAGSDAPPAEAGS